MRKLIAILTGLSFSMAAFGEDLLQCLDPHLVQSLIAPSATRPATRITTDVPAELEGFVVPAGFDWIGSLEGEVRKTIALKTTLAAADAADAAVEALKAVGWTQAPRTPSPGLVFVPAGGPSAGADMCRGEASGSVIVRDVEGARYVNFVWSGAGALSACRPSLNARPAFMDELRAEMPTLRLPDGTVNASGGVSGGGSNRDFRTTVRVRSDATPAEVVDQLGRQMSEQGWSIDSDWAGRHGAGATWSREGSGGRVLGTFEIVELGDATMEMQFRLRSL